MQSKLSIASILPELTEKYADEEKLSNSNNIKSENGLLFNQPHLQPSNSNKESNEKEPDTGKESTIPSPKVNQSKNALNQDSIEQERQADARSNNNSSPISSISSHSSDSNKHD